MADDPVEAARKREAAMLRRGSYFPAANLRQYEGTELSPPGAGTYYNPQRYAGAPASLQRRAQRALAGQYQSDLAFNVMANPRMAQSLEAGRIGAQYGGSSKFGKAGYTTINLPGGGTTTVPNREAKGILSKVSGSSVFDPEKIRAEGFAKGFGASPAPQVVPGAGGDYLSRGGVMNPIENLSPSERLQYSPTRGQGFFESITRRDPFYQNLAMQGISALGRIGTLGYNAIRGLFSGSQPRFADNRSDINDMLNQSPETQFLGRPAATPTPTMTPATTSRLATAPIGYQTDFMGAPSALQESFGQPRRYFDL